MIVIGYATSGNVTDEFTDSLCSVLMRELHKEPGASRTIRTIIKAKGAYIDDNRNRLVKMFLDLPERYPFYLSVDTDIEFPPELPDKMLEALATRPDVGILAANVPMFTNRTAGYLWEPEKDLWRGIAELPEGEQFIEVDAVAGSLILIRRECLESIIAKYGPFSAYERLWVGKDQSGKAGEDLSLCIRARECGWKVVLMRYPGVRHWKRVPLQDGFELGG